jgi:hypothetical protein
VFNEHREGSAIDEQTPLDMLRVDAIAVSVQKIFTDIGKNSRGK